MNKTASSNRKRTARAKNTTNPPPPPAPSATTLNGRIEHVIVLMMENRSFDHIFGYRPGVEGLAGNESNFLDPTKPESDTNPAFFVDNGAPFAVLAGQGPGHSLDAANTQLCNSKNGPTSANPALNN